MKHSLLLLILVFLPLIGFSQNTILIPNDHDSDTDFVEVQCWPDGIAEEFHIPFPPICYGKRNDSILAVQLFYHEKQNELLDSVVIKGVHVLDEKGNWWVCVAGDGTTMYCKFRKVMKKSKHYLKTAPLMDFEAEMKIRGFKVFDQNGYMIERNFRFGTISITKTY